ncbi:hypothetical protein RRG08_021612 [Elysia crispata]|uniref:Uncharacterized protein n=1 Tax=Elysia crispata TaxID=231223 RepID=A0AAE1CEF0_9GAST|nr:hypothetical protein RRG08_021612 [Elysia crispata]
MVLSGMKVVGARGRREEDVKLEMTRNTKLAGCLDFTKNRRDTPGTISNAQLLTTLQRTIGAPVGENLPLTRLMLPVPGQ